MCADKVNAKTGPASGAQVPIEEDPLANSTDSSRQLPYGGGGGPGDVGPPGRPRPSLSRRASHSSRQMPLKSFSRMSYGQTAGFHDSASRQAFRRASWARQGPTGVASGVSGLASSLPPPRGMQLAVARAHPGMMSIATTHGVHSHADGAGVSARLVAATSGVPGRGIYAGRPAGGGGAVGYPFQDGPAAAYYPSLSNFGSSLFLNSFGSPANGMHMGAHMPPNGGVPPLGLISSARGSSDWCAELWAGLALGSAGRWEVVDQRCWGAWVVSQ
jgi:hypothetical protein